MATAAKPVNYKLPTKITGALSDRLYEVRARRLALQKEVDALAAEEAAIKEHFINLLPKSETSGIAGKLCRVTVVNKTRPSVVDEDAFHKYVIKNKAWDLVPKSVNSAAVNERWDAGKEIPGIEAFNYPYVSINKV